MSEATLRAAWVSTGRYLTMDYWTFEFEVLNGTIKLEEAK